MQFQKYKNKYFAQYKYLILAFWVALIGSLLVNLFMDDIRRTLKQEVSVNVYTNHLTCESEIDPSLKYICKRKFDQSKDVSASIFWPYTSQDDCQDDFGVCEKFNTASWRPVQLAFALVNNDDSYDPIPVYYSTTKGTFMTASGYPLKIGLNYVHDFKKESQIMFRIAGSFDEKMCFSMLDGNTRCTTKNELLNQRGEEDLYLLQYSFTAKRG